MNINMTYRKMRLIFYNKEDNMFDIVLITKTFHGPNLLTGSFPIWKQCLWMLMLGFGFHNIFFFIFSLILLS